MSAQFLHTFCHSVHIPVTPQHSHPYLYHRHFHFLSQPSLPNKTTIPITLSSCYFHIEFTFFLHAFQKTSFSLSVFRYITFNCSSIKATTSGYLFLFVYIPSNNPYNTISRIFPNTPHQIHSGIFFPNL